jgi:hypothetical protein
VNIDQAQARLVPLLRFTLMSPSDDSKSLLLAELEAMAEGIDQESVTDTYWWNLLLNASQECVNKPSTGSLRFVSEIVGHYHGLVSKRLIEPQRIARVKQFPLATNNRQWLQVEIKDRTIAFINSPNDETRRILIGQLESYLQMV